MESKIVCGLFFFFFFAVNYFLPSPPILPFLVLSHLRKQNSNICSGSDRSICSAATTFGSVRNEICSYSVTLCLCEVTGVAAVVVEVVEESFLLSSKSAVSSEMSSHNPYHVR